MVWWSRVPRPKGTLLTRVHRPVTHVPKPIILSPEMIANTMLQAAGFSPEAYTRTVRVIEKRYTSHEPVQWLVWLADVHTQLRASGIAPTDTLLRSILRNLHRYPKYAFAVEPTPSTLYTRHANRVVYVIATADVRLDERW